MPPKVRIQRKKRPFLHYQTKRNFAFAKLIAEVLSFFAAYGGVADQARFDEARIRNRDADTQLKQAREHLVLEELRYKELRNLKMMRELGLPNQEETKALITDGSHENGELW